MKRNLLVLLFLVMNLVALPQIKYEQGGGGLMGYGRTDGNVSSGGLLLPDHNNSNDDHNLMDLPGEHHDGSFAPVGSGCLLLLGLSLGYVCSKKNKAAKSNHNSKQ